jgi:DNA-binding response OmpR family regulator
MRFVTAPLSMLLISESPVLAEQLSLTLTSAVPLNVSALTELALASITTQDTALVILDMLNGEAWLFEAVTRLRKQYPALGLIGLVDGLRLADKLRALRCGVDHVLTRPWLPEELNASVDNLLLRLTQTRPAVDTGVLQLDSRFRVLRGPVCEQALSRSEFLVLMAFAKAPGHQLDIWEIYEALKKNEDDLPKQALEAQIYRLRKKLKVAGAGKQVLKSIRLQGYQLCNPIKIS